MLKISDLQSSTALPLGAFKWEVSAAKDSRSASRVANPPKCEQPDRIDSQQTGRWPFHPKKASLDATLCSSIIAALC